MIAPSETKSRLAATYLLGLGLPGLAWAQASDPAAQYPLVRQDDALRVSDHVYVILDDDVRFVPNVGIVIGARATRRPPSWPT